MRDIKFRARDIVTGEILTQLYMGQCFQWVNHERQNNIIIEQSTGLTDKNGVDIYEGDIVKHLDGYSERRIGVAGYRDDIAAFEFNCSDCVVCQESGVYGDNMEVIGNIHQNPELLK